MPLFLLALTPALGLLLYYYHRDRHPEPWRLVATNKRAFWVSAGTDGNFQTGDDNVYSTEVIKQDKP